MTTLTKEDFLAVMRCWPAGVSVLTFAGPPPHGLTVSSFSSVSVDPALVVACIGAETTGAGHVGVGTEVGMNLLAVDQQEISNRFAWVKDEDRFAEGEWDRSPGRPPVLLDAVAWMRGEIVAIHPGGTHLVLLIEAREHGLGRAEGAPPLVYWNRAYRRLAED